MKRRKSSSSSSSPLPPRQKAPRRAAAGAAANGKNSAAAGQSAHYAVRILSGAAAAQISGGGKAGLPAGWPLFCLYSRSGEAAEDAPLGYCFIRPNMAAAFARRGAAEGAEAAPAEMVLRFFQADIPPRAKKLLLLAAADYCRKQEQDPAAAGLCLTSAAGAGMRGNQAAAKPLYYKLRPQNPLERALYPRDPAGRRGAKAINLFLRLPVQPLIELPARRKL